MWTYKVIEVSTNTVLGIFYDYDVAEDFCSYMGTLNRRCEVVFYD